jgi:predicted GIY-YIG superfamily endonuclease
LDLPGIYCLFGGGEDEAKPIVYIGQTEDARTRLESHNKRRMFWKTAIFFVSVLGMVLLAASQRGESV